MTNATLKGKPDAGNPHVRFDEGEVVASAKPRRGSLLDKRLMLIGIGAASLSLCAETVTSIRNDDNGHSKLFEAACDSSGSTYYWSDHKAPHADADYVATHLIRTHASATSVPCNSFTVKCAVWGKSFNNVMNFTGPLVFAGEGGYNKVYIGNWNANGLMTFSSDVSVTVATPAETPLWGYPASDVLEKNAALQKYVFKAPKITSPATAGLVLTENPTLNAGIEKQTFSLRFEGDCSEYFGSIELRKGGWLYVAGTKPDFPAKLTVRNGGTLWLEKKATGLTSLTLESGSLVEMEMDASTDTIASIAASEFSSSGRVHLKIRPSATLAKDYVLANLGTVLQVPVSSGLTSEDIDVEIERRATTGLPLTLLVSSDTDGVRSFSFKAFDTVTLTAGDASGKSSFAPNAGGHSWSDAEWPSVGKDYFVETKTLRTLQGNNWPTDTFAGDTLTLDRAELGMKDPGVIKELFMVNSTDRSPSPKVTSYGGITNRLSGGRIHVETWSLFPVPVYAANWSPVWGLVNGGWPKVIEPRCAIVDSRLCGAGQFVALLNNPDAQEDFQRPGYLELTADNTAFRGQIVVKSEYARSPVTNGADSVVMWLAFSEEKNLCQNDTEFRYYAIQLDRGGLWAKETVDLTDTKRGIEITGNENGGWFRSDAGKTFTIRSQITMRKPIHKVGEGTLALGGLLSHQDSSGQSAPVTGQNEVYVQAGTVKAASTNGFDGAALKFSPGAGIEVDVDETDADVRTYGFYDVKWSAPFDLTGCGGKLRVKVTSKAAKFSREPFAVATVSASAPDLTNSFVFDLPYDKCEAVVSKTANADATVTYTARLRGTSGLCLIIR